MKTQCVKCKYISRDDEPFTSSCEIYEKLSHIDKVIALYDGVEDCFMYDPKIKTEYEKSQPNRLWVAVEPTGIKSHDMFRICKKAIELLSDVEKKDCIETLKKYFEDEE